MKWIGYPYPQRWGYKKDIPPEYRPMVKYVEFLFERGFSAFDINGNVLMPDGQFMPTVEFWLNTPGHVVGPIDMQTAGALPWSNEWKAAFSEWRSDKMKAKGEA